MARKTNLARLFARRPFSCSPGTGALRRDRARERGRRAAAWSTIHADNPAPSPSGTTAGFRFQRDRRLAERPLCAAKTRPSLNGRGGCNPFSNLGLAYLYDVHHVMKRCLSTKFEVWRRLWRAHTRTPRRRSGTASPFGQLQSRKRPRWILLAILMVASLT